MAYIWFICIWMENTWIIQSLNSEWTSVLWLVPLFYTLFLSHRILFHSLRLLALDMLQK